MKAAVIGIGSNSVRMLIAETGAGEIRRLARDREGTRLFAGLDEWGNLSEESMEKTAAAVARMAESARQAGVEALHIFATSASRDARNGEAFIRRIRERSGCELEIISGEEEAELSFLGASAAARGSGLIGVIDIGGGSTEIVTGDSRHVVSAISCQMGAVRLYNLLQITGREDMTAAEAAATLVLEDKLAEHPLPAKPVCWVGTGGTFTTMAAMTKQIPWTDRTNMHGTVVSEPEIRLIGGELADMTPEERLRLPGLQPSRADIVVHGVCILLAVMKKLEIGTIIVSEFGNLDGYMRKKYGQSV